jgi:hypothetical protein
MRSGPRLSFQVISHAVIFTSLIIINGTASARMNEPRPAPSLAIGDTENPIALAIFVPQKDLSVRADPSVHADRGSFGLVGMIVEDAIISGSAKKGRRETEELRRSLADYPIDNIALKATQAGFGNLSKVRLLDSNVSHTGEPADEARVTGSYDGDYVASLSYDYGIDPEYSRSTVFCELHVVKTSASTPRASDVPGEGMEAVAAYRAHSITNFADLPRDKQFRVSALAGERLSQFKASLELGFSKCAELLALQANDPSFSRRISDVMAAKKMIFANKTSPAFTQDYAWVIDGGENITRESFGAFGLKLNYVTAGTLGALLYSVRGFPVHQRTVGRPLS